MLDAAVNVAVHVQVLFVGEPTVQILVLLAVRIHAVRQAVRTAAAATFLLFQAGKVLLHRGQAIVWLRYSADRLDHSQSVHVHDHQPAWTVQKIKNVFAECDRYDALLCQATSVRHRLFELLPQVVREPLYIEHLNRLIIWYFAWRENG